MRFPRADLPELILSIRAGEKPLPVGAERNSRDVAFRMKLFDGLSTGHVPHLDAPALPYTRGQPSAVRAESNIGHPSMAMEEPPSARFLRAKQSDRVRRYADRQQLSRKGKARAGHGTYLPAQEFFGGANRPLAPMPVRRNPPASDSGVTGRDQEITGGREDRRPRAIERQESDFPAAFKIPQSCAVRRRAGQHSPIGADVYGVGAVIPRARFRQDAMLGSCHTPNADSAVTPEGEMPVVPAELPELTCGGKELSAAGWMPKSRGSVPGVGGQEVARMVKRHPHRS